MIGNITPVFHTFPFIPWKSFLSNVLCSEVSGSSEMRVVPPEKGSWWPGVTIRQSSVLIITRSSLGCRAHCCTESLDNSYLAETGAWGAHLSMRSPGDVYHSPLRSGKVFLHGGSLDKVRCNVWTSTRWYIRPETSLAVNSSEEIFSSRSKCHLLLVKKIYLLAILLFWQVLILHCGHRGRLKWHFVEFAV